MYHYTAIQWICFFFIYCFIGWVWESSYVSVKEKHLTNRGFIRGPFLPIYGSGAIVMLFCASPCNGNLPLIFLVGMLGATALEYVTGALMEAIFKVRYWDYSNQKFNLNGHICLTSSLAWGAFTLLLTQLIHRPVEHVVLSVSSAVLTPVTLVVMAGFFIDFGMSFKAAIDLRNILVRMEQVKMEMGHLQKRMDVIIALNAQDLERRKEAISQKLDELGSSLQENTSNTWKSWKESAESKLSALKQAATEVSPSETIQKSREEIGELVLRFRQMTEEHLRLSNVRDFLMRSSLRGNPGMVASPKYREYLEEIKENVHRKPDHDLDGRNIEKTYKNDVSDANVSGFDENKK